MTTTTQNGRPSVVGYTASDAALTFLRDAVHNDEAMTRRDTCRDVRLIYAGKFRGMVVESLRQRFHPSIFQKLNVDQGAVQYHTLLRDIMGKICTGFRNGAKYALRAAGQELESPEFQDLLKSLRYDALLRGQEVQTRLHGAVFCHAVVVACGSGERRFRHVVHTPETFDLLPDPQDPTGHVGVVLYWDHQERAANGARRTEQRATVMTAEWWRVFGRVNSTGHWGLLHQEVNPYGVIPGHVWTSSDADSLWPDCDGPRLAEATLEMNEWQTFQKLMAANWTKVLAGEFGETLLMRQYISPGGVVNLGKGAESPNVLDFTTDLAGFNEAQVERTRRSMASAFGLAVDEFQQAAAESGAALQLRYWNRDQMAMQLRPILVDHLKSQWDVDYRVLHVELGRAGAGPVKGVPRLPPGPVIRMARREDGLAYVAAAEGGPEFCVDVNEMEYPETSAERQARVDWEIKMGFTTVGAEMRRRNPDLTEEEADEVVKRNLATSAGLANPARVRLDLLLGSGQDPAADAEPGGEPGAVEVP